MRMVGTMRLWRTPWWASQTRLGSRWSQRRTATTSSLKTEPNTMGSRGLLPSDQTPTTLFSQEMAFTWHPNGGSAHIMVNIGLREEWKDWQISSVDTHSRSLSLTLTPTPSPR